MVSALLEYHKLLSIFAFKFNLRRYAVAALAAVSLLLELNAIAGTAAAAAATAAAEVGRCRLPLSNPS
jgi:hypothetical protein